MHWRGLDLGKWVVLGGAAVLLLATLFPPWTVTVSHMGPAQHFVVSLKYDFLFSPPRQYGTSGALDRTSLNLSILLAEWAAIALVTAALYFVFRPKP